MIIDIMILIGLIGAVILGHTQHMPKFAEMMMLPLGMMIMYIGMTWRGQDTTLFIKEEFRRRGRDGGFRRH